MPAKIAIVEDDPAITQLYRLKFETEGYTVETAENGELGLKLAETMRPDVILLDLLMPVMDGNDMLAKLRATDWGKGIKVIILTNAGEQESPEMLKQFDVKHVIVKANMTPRQVVELVKSELTS